MIKKVIIFLMFFTLVSCKTKKIHCFMSDFYPTSKILIIDSFILVSSGLGTYNTGKVSKIKNDETLRIAYDSVPFNNNNILKISYEKVDNLILEKLHLDFINVPMHFFCQIKDKEFAVKEDTSVLIDKHDFNNKLKFKFKFNVMNYNYTINYTDSNTTFLAFDTLKLNSNNVVQIDCSELFLYYFFNGGKKSSNNKIIFSNNRNNLILTSPDRKFSKHKEAFKNNEIREIKSKKCKNHLCHFIDTFYP